jgi:hypothetical protein
MKFSNYSYELVFMDFVCWLGLLHKTFTFFSILVLGICMLYWNVYCAFSLLSPIDVSPISDVYAVVVILTSKTCACLGRNKIRVIDPDETWCQECLCWRGQQQVNRPTDIRCPLIEVSSFGRTRQNKRRPPLTWEGIQIQFPKRCVLFFFRIPDDGRCPKAEPSSWLVCIIHYATEYHSPSYSLI